jgi:hypothetical protein
LRRPRRWELLLSLDMTKPVVVGLGWMKGVEMLGRSGVDGNRLGALLLRPGSCGPENMLDGKCCAKLRASRCTESLELWLRLPNTLRWRLEMDVYQDYRVNIVQH